jgi:hypothetical protein
MAETMFSKKAPIVTKDSFRTHHPWYQGVHVLHAMNRKVRQVSDQTFGLTREDFSDMPPLRTGLQLAISFNAVISAAVSASVVKNPGARRSVPVGKVPRCL